MPPILLQRGRVFGRLTVVQRTARPLEGLRSGRLWICRCACGNMKRATATDLLKCRVQSCGCLKREQIVARNKAGALHLVKGQRFGKLTVLGPSKKRLGGAIHWKCRCDCGTIRHVASHDLRKKSRSCGCTKLIATRMANTQHGHKTNYDTTLTYNAWRGMLDRCRHNTHYIELGITVCVRWERFENFVNDMGARPSRRHWLDRKNPWRNYSKRNCRWLAGAKANGRNRTNTVWVVYRGKRMALSELAERSGIPWLTLRSRLRRGMSPERATTTLPNLPQIRRWLRHPRMRRLLRAELACFGTR